MEGVEENRKAKETNMTNTNETGMEEEMIDKLQIGCREKLIGLWRSLNPGERERFMFKKVILDQNIPDILNEKEMGETLTPKREEATDKYAKRVIEAITTYIRKGGRRTLGQIVGVRMEFLLATLNILDIKELKMKELYDIPLPMLMGVITMKLKESVDGLPIEEVTSSWNKIDWSDQTRIGLEAIKYIADIMASRDRLMATFKQNEANVIEYLYKRIGNTALRNHFRNYQEEKSHESDNGKGKLEKITTMDRFTEILREVSSSWEKEAIDVRNRSANNRNSNGNNPSTNSPKRDNGENKRKRAEMEVNVAETKLTRYCYNCWFSNHLIAECTAPKYEVLSAEEKIKRQKRTKEAKRKMEEEKKKLKDM